MGGRGERKERTMPEYATTTSYCRICGHEPASAGLPPHAMNRLCRFWSPDDGWIVGALCPSCHDDYSHVQPKRGDYAYDRRGAHTCELETDEDPILVL